VPFSLHLSARAPQVASELERAMNASGDELAPSALAIARVEYPSLDASPCLAELDRLGREARARVGRDPEPGEGVRLLNEYLYDEQGFTGNREQYDDPRNSFLNDVLDRRTGIPIALAVVYLEVARRAGIHVAGVNFPGHFLLRSAGAPADAAEDALIIDPFHAGALLSEGDCRELLRQHIGEEAAFDRSLLAPATRRDIVVRMLVNLKRLYVRMRSFPQARFISHLLLSVDPSAVSELRDRGLLAYHLEDFAAALRDLEEYLRLVPKRPPGSDDDREAAGEHSEPDAPPGDDETAQVWEHVKALRKRVAGFN
jgi:regulator of sirC expression with transglutaminase-like and TPR domain